MNSALANDSKLSNASKGGVKILVVAGSSGGHIFPALGFLEALKERVDDIEALLVLPKGSLKNRRAPLEYKAEYISISSLSLSCNFKNFVAIFKLLKGCLESIFILLRFRPDIAVGFGSLASIPVIMFARIFRIKTIIHEQNVVPGRANRFLAKISDRVALSFMESKGYFKGCERKLAVTGNPLRKGLIRVEKMKALDFFGFDRHKFTLLVTGGSLGSHRINTELLKAVTLLADKTKLQIIHLSGSSDYDLLAHSYKDLDVRVKLFSFLEDMQYAYSACDLILSRAGATTITEMIFFGLPAIVVPYPYAYKHQLSNAGLLERAGSAVVIQDDKLNAKILSEAINNFMNNPDKLKAMRSSYEGFPKADANSIFADTVLSLN